MIEIAELACDLVPGPRPAAVVRARAASGAVGVGEATPLAGRSADTTADVEIAVAGLGRALPLTLSPRRPLEAIAELAATAAPAAPAARFAIETALLDVVARATGRSLARVLAAQPAASVPLNALVATADEAAAAVARGITCVKVKTHTDFERDHARVAAIATAVGRGAVRVDANQRWPLATVRRRLVALAALGVEYVEEPAVGLAPSLRWVMPCPIALDESLAVADVDGWLDRALASGAIAAIVLKPALLGGLTRCLALAGRARAAGVAAVVTHSLDGPVATAAACELALALGATRPVGLDRHPGLDDWPGLDVPQLAAAAVVDRRAPGLGIDPAAVARAVAARAGAPAEEQPAAPTVPVARAGTPW